LRHSALTHDAEEGTGTPMLLARSGHVSVRSLARYARVSAEALQRHQAQRDPARRRQSRLADQGHCKCIGPVGLNFRVRIRRSSRRMQTLGNGT
jgi:hypothetical protein